VVITGDPRISRIDKIFGENGPKFLDLYASIYGRCCKKNLNFI
jgi:hypothetical protein